MGPADFLHDHHIVPAFVPVADAFAAGLTTEAVNLSKYRRATLVIITGAIEDTGVSNIVTVEACTAADGTDNTAMPFRYRVQLYSTTVDAWSAWAQATASGYNFSDNNTVANTVWMLEVTAEAVGAAFEGAEFVRAVIAETADKTITAGGIWILSEPRYAGAIPVTAIV